MIILKISCLLFFSLTFVFGDAITTYYASKLPNVAELNPIVNLMLKNRFLYILWNSFKLLLGIISFDYIFITLILGIYGSIITYHNYKTWKENT